MAEKKELQQTKSMFKVRGKVTRIDKDNAFRQAESTKGKMEGKTYRSLRFGVKTSPTNDITVEMFDFEPEEVFMWNSEKRKQNQSYKGDRVPFAEWEENQEQYREDGYAILQTRVGLAYGEDGKLDSKGLPSYVASKEIYDSLNNGDCVVIEGEIRYSKYKNNNDEEVEQKSHLIKKIYRTKDIDFEDASYEEMTFFEQEFVFVDCQIEKKEAKAFVMARIIDYSKNWHDTQMVIDFSDGEGGYDQEMVKLADAFNKKIKFGDVVKVYGDTVNRVIVEEVEGDDAGEEEDLISQLGGKAKPKHAQGYQSRTYIQEMQIHGVEHWDRKIYKESDFEKDEFVEDDKKNKMSDEFGGKGKNPFAKDKDDPFANSNDDIDIDEDDLPF